MAGDNNSISGSHPQKNEGNEWEKLEKGAPPPVFYGMCVAAADGVTVAGKRCTYFSLRVKMKRKLNRRSRSGGGGA